MKSPYLKIDLKKITSNAKMAIKMWGKYGIDVTAITKVDLGEPKIAKCLVDAGIKVLGDSRVDDIIRMKKAGIEATYVLIRTPFKSDVKRVVKYVDISLNSELVVIEALSKEAIKQNKKHKIILMVEMGDRREGILPKNLENEIELILKFKGIEIIGIGANFACFGGIKPNQEKMNHLSLLVDVIEYKFHIKLSIVSGGNSANYKWLKNHDNIGRINNIRLGESLFLGVETLNREPLNGFYNDAFTLVAEIIECKIKPSLPNGEIALNAFGEIPHFEDKGNMKRAIVGIGREDINIKGLKPYIDIDVLGGSSDHIIIDVKQTNLKVGDNISFNLNYSALLLAMTSPFVKKVFI